jgi:hypothetical protein
LHGKHKKKCDKWGPSKMRREAGGPCLSAVFVDYDNIYLSLKRKSEEAARRFAKDASAWLRGIETGRLWVVNNSLHNRYLNAAFVRNRSQRPVTVLNNVAVGAPISLKAGIADLQTNYQAPDHGLRDAPKLDFGLKPDSPLIDAGTDPGSVDGVSLWPEFEYVHPASGRPRQRVAAIDIGAREFCGW